MKLLKLALIVVALATCGLTSVATGEILTTVQVDQALINVGGPFAANIPGGSNLTTVQVDQALINVGGPFSADIPGGYNHRSSIYVDMALINVGPVTAGP